MIKDHSSHSLDVSSTSLAMTGLCSTALLSTNVVHLFCAGHVLWGKTMQGRAQPSQSRRPCEGPEQEKQQRHRSVPGFPRGLSVRSEKREFGTPTVGRRGESRMPQLSLRAAERPPDKETGGEASRGSQVEKEAAPVREHKAVSTVRT